MDVSGDGRATNQTGEGYIHIEGFVVALQYNQGAAGCRRVDWRGLV